MPGAGKLSAVGGHGSKTSHTIYPRIFELSIEALEQEFHKRPDIPLNKTWKLSSYLSVPYSAKSLRSKIVTQMLSV
jgi:hypothetical protein